MFIPIRPGEYSRLDQLDGLHADDIVPSPYPPVPASVVRIRRLAQERAERELRAQRRAERKATLLVGAFIVAFASITAVVEWAAYVTVVHP